MENQVTFFPVGTADMSLVQLSDGYSILVDCYLLEELADNRHTIANDLYERLPEDDQGRPYVDAFLLTHPDEDHCKGALKYLHLDSPDTYNNSPKDNEQKKIFVREMWSSPIIYRRRSEDHKLCDDAAAINSEAKRRVKVFRGEHNGDPNENGNRVLILGSDYKEEDGSDRLEGLDNIRIDVDEAFKLKDNQDRTTLIATILAPLSPSEVEGDEDVLTKNNSSVIMQMEVKPQSVQDAGNLLLFGGDAEVEIWRRIWDKHQKNVAPLFYDILLGPHHCSWGVLSDEPASRNGVQADLKARNALEQGRDNAYIVTSCEPIKDNTGLPPMLRAKQEYINILEDTTDHFLCTGEHPTKDAPEPLTFDLKPNGPKAPSKKTLTTGLAAAPAIISREPRPHG